jgi:hypothetical protein
MSIITSFVKTPIPIPAVVGQLVTDIFDSLLCIEGHAFRGVTFGVDACKDGPKSLPDRERTEGFRGDEYDFSGLSLFLPMNQFMNNRIDLF